MKVNFPKRVSCQRLIRLTYAAGSIALVCVALWDAQNIFKDYITDNRMTTTKRLGAPDDFACMGKIAVCLQYDRPVFPGITMKTEEFYAAFKTYWQKRYDNDSRPVDEHAEEDVFHLLISHGLIYYMDINGPDYAFYVWGSADSNMLVNNTELDLAVSAFLNNPKAIRRTAEAIKRTSHYFLRASGKNEHSVSLKSMAEESVCFDLQQDGRFRESKIAPFDSRRRLPPVRYELDFAPIINGTVPEQFSAASLHIRTSDGNAEMIPNASSNETTVVNYVVSNFAVLDSKRFPPCTENFATDEDCLDMVKTIIIESECNCTQFTKFIRKGSSAKEMERMQFCAPHHYRLCWIRAMEKYSDYVGQAGDSRMCQPCQTYFNNYRIEKTVTNSMAYASAALLVEPYAWYHRSVLTFDVISRPVIVFEERLQLGLAQFLSQVGGNLGLFLGFSMFSLLQLLPHLYSLYRDRIHDSAPSDRSFQQVTREWIRYLWENIGGTGEEGGSNFGRHGDVCGQLEQHPDNIPGFWDLRRRIAILESASLTIRADRDERIACLEKAVDRIDHKLERLCNLHLNESRCHL